MDIDYDYIIGNSSAPQITSKSIEELIDENFPNDTYIGLTFIINIGEKRSIRLQKIFTHQQILNNGYTEIGMGINNLIQEHSRLYEDISSIPVIGIDGNGYLTNENNAESITWIRGVNGFHPDNVFREIDIVDYLNFQDSVDDEFIEPISDSHSDIAGYLPVNRYGTIDVYISRSIDTSHAYRLDDGGVDEFDMSYMPLSLASYADEKFISLEYNANDEGRLRITNLTQDVIQVHLVCRGDVEGFYFEGSNSPYSLQGVPVLTFVLDGDETLTVKPPVAVKLANTTAENRKVVLVPKSPEAEVLRLDGEPLDAVRIDGTNGIGFCLAGNPCYGSSSSVAVDVVPGDFFSITIGGEEHHDLSLDDVVAILRNHGLDVSLYYSDETSSGPADDT